MTRDAQRDMAGSPFGTILERLHAEHDGVVAAVFYDDEGETIDYHSFLDPFDTRLAAAHHGVVVSSATQRMAWLRLGTVQALEVHTDKLASITLPVGGGTFLTVLTAAGALSDPLLESIDSAVIKLRMEAGF